MGDVVLVAEQNPLLHILVKMEFSVQSLCVHNMESTKDQSLSFRKKGCCYSLW